MGDLISFYGATDGSNTTGTFTLNSEWLENTVTQIKIPRGKAAKIWVFEQSNKAGRVQIKYTDDGGTTWNILKVLTLPSDGHLEIDPRKPVMFTSRNDSTYVRFDWDQDTADDMYIEVNIEFSEFE